MTLLLMLLHSGLATLLEVISRNGVSCGLSFSPACYFSCEGLILYSRDVES